MSEPTPSDVQAALDAAGQPIELLDLGNRHVVAVPDGWTLQAHDSVKEHLLDDRPARARGTTRTLSANGFCLAVTRQVAGYQTPAAEDDAPPVTESALYADQSTQKLVCVLNDHYAGVPGHRDHRVELGIQITPEWQHWKDSGGLKPQAEFARIIDKGLPEIHQPPAASMLEVAETFEATVSAKVGQVSKIGNGARSLVFEETVEAKAGGRATVPDTMTLHVVPFVGCTKAYPIEAKIRFTVREGKLSIGYELLRPHEVERQAFLDLVTEISTQLELACIDGVAPEPTIKS